MLFPLFLSLFFIFYFLSKTYLINGITIIWNLLWRISCHTKSYMVIESMQKCQFNQICHCRKKIKLVRAYREGFFRKIVAWMLPFFLVFHFLFCFFARKSISGVMGASSLFPLKLFQWIIWESSDDCNYLRSFLESTLKNWMAERCYSTFSFEVVSLVRWPNLLCEVEKNFVQYHFGRLRMKRGD